MTWIPVVLSSTALMLSILLFKRWSRRTQQQCFQSILDAGTYEDTNTDYSDVITGLEAVGYASRQTELRAVHRYSDPRQEVASYIVQFRYLGRGEAHGHVDRWCWGVLYPQPLGSAVFHVVKPSQNIFVRTLGLIYSAALPMASGYRWAWIIRNDAGVLSPPLGNLLDERLRYGEQLQGGPGWFLLLLDETNAYESLASIHKRMAEIGLMMTTADPTASS